MAKTQTKTEVRNATAKIGKLLRGIDNSTQTILRDKKKLDEKIVAVQKDTKQVQTLISAISNTALVAMAAPAPAKPAPAKPQGGGQAKASGNGQKAAKPAPAKAAEKKPAKAEKKPAKPAPAKKQAEKKPAKPAPAGQAKAKPAQAKPQPQPAAADRPALKQVITDILKAGKEPMLASDIYKAAVAKHGYWSRQSLYNALKDPGFSKSGDKFGLASAAPEKKDAADAFLEKVEKDQATAHVS